MRYIVAMLIGLAFAVSVQADSMPVTLTSSTNAAVVSDAIPISGYLERIEITQTAGRTNTITLASYEGSTAVDAFVSLTDLAGNKVVRPRVIGTTTAGVNLASVVTADAGVTNAAAGQVLVAQYDKVLVGGTIKLAATANAANGTNSTAIKAVIYWSPIHK
jgi:hypothetical protein